MDVKIEIGKVVDNSELIKKALPEQIEQALIAIGSTAESNAKDNCPVDTGLLRNSITYAIGGQAPAITGYSDNNNEQHGSYSGNAPADIDGETTLYVGTNVEYAEYIELGHSKKAPKGFLKIAMTGHTAEYSRLLKDALT